MLIGTQVAGRTHTELDPIVGMFTNTVPLRMSLADDPTFAGLLGRVRDITVDAAAHQQVPFEKLVEEFAPDRTLAHAPLIQVQFVYGSLTPPDAGSSWHRHLLVRELFTATAKLDLTVYADAMEGQEARRRFRWNTAPTCSTAAWADRFLRCMATLLGTRGGRSWHSGSRPADAVGHGARRADHRAQPRRRPPPVTTTARTSGACSRRRRRASSMATGPCR